MRRYAVLGAIELADAATTYGGMRLGGVEHNGPAAALMAHCGLVVALAVYCLAKALGVWFLVYAVPRLAPAAANVYYLAVAATAAAVGWNAYTLVGMVRA